MQKFSLRHGYLILIHETAALLFAEDPLVAFTNNIAERDLRISKGLGLFQNKQIRTCLLPNFSYLQSMANKGYIPLIAIQIALAGEAHKLLGK